ncbi:hypothetical protein WN943_027655 [Citrus x changshan-huyou]
MSSVSFSPFFWTSPPPFYKSLPFYNNSSTLLQKRSKTSKTTPLLCKPVAAIPPLSFSVSSSILQIPAILQQLFYTLAETRQNKCSLRDKEVECREKAAEIRDLKEKVVRVSSLARQLESQKGELIHQLKLQVSAFDNYAFIPCFALKTNLGGEYQ